MCKVKKGRIHSEETKNKISESLKGIPRSKETIQKIKETRTKSNYKHSEETRRKMSKSHEGRKHSEKTKIKISKGQLGKPKTRTISKIKKKYPIFEKIEEMRYNPDNPKEIQVHCKNHNCLNSKEKGGWFTPDQRQIECRLKSINTDIGLNYFYCSEECKNECPLFGFRVDHFLCNVKDLNYTSSEYNIWRNEVLKRANYKCEYCEDEAIDAHHIKPKKIEPFFSLDPDFGIACCKKCHYKYGHKDECSTGKLASKICE